MTRFEYCAFKHKKNIWVGILLLTSGFIYSWIFLGLGLTMSILLIAAGVWYILEIIDQMGI